MMSQTRSEEHGLKHFPTLGEAFAEAVHDPTVWKLSISLPTGERVRLIRKWVSIVPNDYEWVYESIFGDRQGWRTSEEAAIATLD